VIGQADVVPLGYFAVMTNDAKALNDAARMSARLRTIRRTGPADPVQAQIDELAQSIEGLAKYLMDARGLSDSRLHQRLL
jgi:hypothetical protein